jgi:hypothetical protein
MEGSRANLPEVAGQAAEAMDAPLGCFHKLAAIKLAVTSRQ